MVQLVLSSGSHKADFEVMAGLSNVLRARGRSLLPGAVRVLAEFSSLWVDD